MIDCEMCIDYAAEDDDDKDDCSNDMIYEDPR